MILAIANTKGGVGKTTIAINLAVSASLAGDDVLLVDGDDQGTALAFTELRSGARQGKPGYTAVALRGAAIRTQARQLAPKYAHILIDVGGPPRLLRPQAPLGHGESEQHRARERRHHVKRRKAEPVAIDQPLSQSVKRCLRLRHMNDTLGKGERGAQCRFRPSNDRIP